jgi:hypothetical protein
LTEAKLCGGVPVARLVIESVEMRQRLPGFRKCPVSTISTLRARTRAPSGTRDGYGRLKRASTGEWSDPVLPRAAVAGSLVIDGRSRVADPHLDRDLQRRSPYIWTKTADQILESIATYCTRINESRH